MKRVTMYIVFLMFGLLSACGSESVPAEEVEPSAVEAGGQVEALVEENHDESAVVAATEAPTEEPTAVPTDIPTEVPTEVPTEEPTLEPTPTEMVEMFIPLEELVFELDQLESFEYLVTVEMTSSETGIAYGKMEMSGKQTSVPKGQQVSATILDESDPENPIGLMIEMTEIKDFYYVNFAGMGCVASEESEVQNLTELQDSRALLDGLIQVERVLPNEMINGVETEHYKFDETMIEESAEGVLQDIRGDLYVSVDNGIVVKIEFEGTDPQGVALSDWGSPEDTFKYTYDVFNINQPLQLSLPGGCSAVDAEGQFPRVEDASKFSNISGMESYQTSLSAEEVLAFYAEALPADGWVYSSEESFHMGNLFSDMYERDGEWLQVGVAPAINSDEDKLSVTLVLNP